MRCYICGRASMTMLDSNVWYIKPKTHRWWFFLGIKERKSLLSIHHHQPVSFSSCWNVELLFMFIKLFFAIKYIRILTWIYMYTYVILHTFVALKIWISSIIIRRTMNIWIQCTKVTFLASFLFFQCLCMIAHFVWKWFTSDFRKSP